MKKSILHTTDLSIGYKHPGRPSYLVAEKVSASLHTGEFVCLLGPNGVGKSTLLRTIAGMHPPLRGEMVLMGQRIHQLQPSQLARLLSIVLTDRVDVGTLSAYALVSLGRYPYTNWRGELSEADEAVVQWAISAVGAADLARRSVNELSDGERQKMMIARALAQEPALMLLDEPTAYLDLPRRVEIVQLLRQLAHDTDCAILLSTHDLDLALRSADKIWLMSPDKGLQIGAPEDLVLSGAFEAAFQSEGVTFDPVAGAFQVNKQQVGQVSLHGDGLPMLWTKRALERAGFQVNSVNGSSSSQVTVIRRQGQPVWQYQNDARQNCADPGREYHTLYDLIASITDRLT